jgi:hypothetical protein
MGQISGDAVAAPHAELDKAMPDPADLRAELLGSDVEVTANLGHRAHDDVLRHAAEHVLGVVEGASLEPLGVGHAARRQHCLGRRVEPDVAEVGEFGVEVLDVVD